MWTTSTAKDRHMGIAQVLLGSIKEISTGNHRFIWPGECREDHSVRGASNPHQDHHRERGLEQSEAHGKVPPSIFPSNCRYVMIYCIHIHTHIYIYTHTHTHTHPFSLHSPNYKPTYLSIAPLFRTWNFAPFSHTRRPKRP